MKHLLFLLPLTLLAGCGGGNGSGGGVARFAGTYTATYESVATDNDDGGSLQVTVAPDGTIAGTGTDSRYPNVATTVAAGSLVRAGGTTTLNLSVPQGQASVGITFQGEIDRDGSTLKGTLNQRNGDFFEAFRFTFARVVN